MKTLTLTFQQRVRLTLMMKAHTGTRKDTTLLVLQDLRKRIGVENAELEKYVRSIGDDRLIINNAEIGKQPDIKAQITASEAAILLEKLDAIPLTADDLDAWADDLGRKLQQAAD